MNLKKLIKNRKCYYFDDTTSDGDIYSSDILLDEKSNKQTKIF